MEKVVCVADAKVAIVKMWDPELSLACDMNVNNTLALENTRMVRTYVEIDERVRPLAMIVKYWTRRRVLNDAGPFSFWPFPSLQTRGGGGGGGF
jgi:DNA polymerase sigma